MIVKQLTKRFDLVSWAPRGAGQSTPLACRSKVRPFLALDPDPDGPVEQTAIDDAAKAVADECGRLDSDLLAHLGTDDVARDLEALRIALDDSQLSFMGFSYGTFIGTRYAALFPTHIRAMVLDGPLDPTENLADGLAGQAAAFDAAISKAFDSCTPASNCPVPDLAAAYDQLRARVQQAPMSGSKGRTLGPASLATGDVYVAYDPSLWPDLAAAVAEALDGDPDPMLDLADGYYDLSNFTAYAAVECIDSVTPKGAVEWASFTTRLEAISPRFGGSIANELLPCAYWPVPPVDVTGTVAANGAPPIIVIGNTGDPATPYANAQKLAGMLEQGHLVTYRGEWHTSYGRDQCVDDIVDDYLIALRVPDGDPSCGDG